MKARIEQTLSKPTMLLGLRWPWDYAILLGVTIVTTFITPISTIWRLVMLGFLFIVLATVNLSKPRYFWSDFTLKQIWKLTIKRLDNKQTKKLLLIVKD